MEKTVYSQYQSQPKLHAFGESKITSSDIEGPFYLEGAPERNKVADLPTLYISGRVSDTAGKGVPGAMLDFWQADESGVYDEKGFGLRGVVKTDDEGEYFLETVRPGHYAINEEEERCSHIHVKVSAPDGPVLTTQLYFPEDEANKEDNWYTASRELIDEGDGNYVFDFVISTKFLD